MNVKQYFDLIESIIKENKERKLNISENTLITIVQEYCKDLRTSQIEQSKKDNIDKMQGRGKPFNDFAPNTSKSPTPATPKQTKLLSKLGFKGDLNKLTMEEARMIIKEKLSKRGEDYGNSY